MAYLPHSRVVAIGGIYSADTGGARVDDFSFGVSVDIQPSSGALALMANVFSAYFGTEDSRIPGSARLERLGMLPIGTDGQQSGPGVYFDYGAGGIPGDVGTSHPSYVCLAVTTETVDGSPRIRGRMYPPNYGIGMTGVLASESSVNGVGTATAALLSGLVTAGFTPVVASSQGILAEITSVSVDDVPDTQRRRKYQLNGTRTDFTV